MQQAACPKMESVPADENAEAALIMLAIPSNFVARQAEFRRPMHRIPCHPSTSAYNKCDAMQSLLPHHAVASLPLHDALEVRHTHVVEQREAGAHDDDEAGGVQPIVQRAKALCQAGPCQHGLLPLRRLLITGLWHACQQRQQGLRQLAVSLLSACIASATLPRNTHIQQRPNKIVIVQQG